MDNFAIHLPSKYNDPTRLSDAAPNPYKPLYPLNVAAIASKDRSTSRGAQLARRAQILATARTLLAEGGIEAITMREIANRTGVCTQTVYNLASNRADLIEASMSEYLDAISNASQSFKDYPSVILAISDLYWASAKNFPEYIKAAALACASTDLPFFKKLRAFQARMIWNALKIESRMAIPFSDDVICGKISALNAVATTEWASGLIDLSDLRFQLATSQKLILLLPSLNLSPENIQAWDSLVEDYRGTHH